MTRLTLLALGSIFALLGVPLAARLVPPNGVYGFRTAATLRDRATWYRVNRVAGIDLIGGGALLGLAGWLWPGAWGDPPVSLLAAAVVGVVIVHGLLAARASV